MRNITTVVLFSILVLFVQCGDDDPDSGIENESQMFAECNNMLAACTGGTGPYCLFGFKWGATNPIETPGFSATGPQETAGPLTYSFQEENGIVNTHSQVNLESETFGSLPACARDEIRAALAAWSAAADLTFAERPDNSQTDIKFFVANIRQSGVGYPNYPEAPCNALAGHVIVETDLSIIDCDALRNFYMHEIGHVLGLGHVSSPNIMNSSYSVFRDLEGLQDGDIEGVRQLYGER